MQSDELLERIQALAKLSDYLLYEIGAESPTFLDKIARQNPWFTHKQSKTALTNLGHMLQKQHLAVWVAKYQEKLENTVTNAVPVGIIAAGNIPGVCMHDVFSAFLTGRHVKLKLSKDDTVLPMHLIQRLTAYYPPFRSEIEFVERLSSDQPLIATGSNNTIRHLDYYFKNPKKLLRGNRTSIAILSGKEKNEELKALGNDVFSYFGLGCRNVTKLLVPMNYTFDSFFEAMVEYGDAIQHTKYANNYEYQRALYLLNGEKFLDNNFLIIKESQELHAPTGVLYFQRYMDHNQVLDYLNENKHSIQCVVSQEGSDGAFVKFGCTQQPKPWEYADGEDVVAFLLS